MVKRAVELMSRFSAMKTSRSNHESAWQDISDYMMPFRGDITTKKSGGAKRVKPVFDSTAMIAADHLVNFMKGALLPPSQDWLRIVPPFDYQQDDTIRKLLDKTAQRVLAALSQSNFYTEATGALRDLIVLGNSTMLVEEDTISPGYGGGLLFEAVPIGRMWWTQGKGSRITMVVREYSMPALDAVRYFDNPGKPALTHVSQGRPMEEVLYHQFCYENENKVKGGSPSKTNKNYVSTWICSDGIPPTIIRESGYDTKPYIVSRLHRVDGEEYGRGRGHLARADARGLSELRRQILIAAGRDLNPPLMVEDDTMVDMDIANGGIIVTRPPVKISPNFLKSGADYAAADKIARDDRDQIRQAFLSDVLSEPASQPRSAEESRQRQQRSLQRLASAADIVNNEFLGPVVQSVMGIMSRRNELPEGSEAASMMGGSISATVKFSSPFFSAQKQGSAQRVMSFLERRLALMQATQDPAFIEDIHPDRLREFDMQQSDVPAEIFRTQDEINDIREARAAKEAQAREAEMQQQEAQMQQQQAQAQAQQQQQQGPPPEEAPVEEGAPVG